MLDAPRGALGPTANATPFSLSPCLLPLLSPPPANATPFFLFTCPSPLGDLTCIWHELKAVQLRTLNRERAEMVIERWIRRGAVPDAAEVRGNEEGGEVS